MENKVARKPFDKQKLLAPAALVILYVFFAIFGNNFFSTYTLKTILESAYFIGFMAFGVTFVIITGGIDLSIGTNMMCAAMVGGVAYSMWGWPLGLALILVPLTGLVFGIANGFLVAKLKLPPFIATLGTMLVTQGFGSIISKVQTQRYPTIGSPDEWFKTVFYRTGQFPIGVIYLALAFIIAAFLLNKTRFGRYNFAIGSNEEATRLSGVDVDKWKIMIYAVCGRRGGHLLRGHLYHRHPGQRQRPGAQRHRRRGHRRHLHGGRIGHHGGYPDRRVHHVGAEDRPGLAGPAGPLADLYHRLRGHRRRAAGQLPQQRGGQGQDPGDRPGGKGGCQEVIPPFNIRF